MLRAFLLVLALAGCALPEVKSETQLCTLRGLAYKEGVALVELYCEPKRKHDL